jgi:hypothetical protein
MAGSECEHLTKRKQKAESRSRKQKQKAEAESRKQKSEIRNQ